MTVPRKVLDKKKHPAQKMSHLWFAIGGTVAVVIGLALATCALMGLSVTKLVALIQWEQVATIATILAFTVCGGFAIFVAFRTNPDEVRQRLLMEQRRVFEQELEVAKKLAHDVGYAAGQKVGIEAGVAKATAESSRTQKPIRPTVVTEPSATPASPPATLVATDVIPPPTHTGRPVVVAGAGAANAN